MTCIYMDTISFSYRFHYRLPKRRFNTWWWVLWKRDTHINISIKGNMICYKSNISVCVTLLQNTSYQVWTTPHSIQNQFCCFFTISMQHCNRLLKLLPKHDMYIIFWFDISFSYRFRYIRDRHSWAHHTRPTSNEILIHLSVNKWW
jgi:hypothetical protein